MQPAPWITGHVISEGRKLAGASLVRLAGDDDVPADVPPATSPLVPAQRRPGVPSGVPPTDTPARPLPARHAGRHRAPDPAGDGQPVPSAGAGGRHRAADPDRPAIPPAGDGLIIGIADAASYLGYDKPESFRRARTRTPVPGEGKDARWPALLDPRHAAQLAIQAEDRRQPHAGRGTRLAGGRA